MAAAQSGHTHVVEELVKEGADVNHQCDVMSISPISDPNQYRSCVDTFVHSLHSVLQAGRTSLLHATSGGHEDIVTKLVANHADINIQDKVSHCSRCWTVIIARTTLNTLPFAL